MTKEQVVWKRTGAVDPHEFHPFFVPFEREDIAELLICAKFEVGAAYSLFRIWKNILDK